MRQKSDRGHAWYSLAAWRDIKAAFRMNFPERAVICQGTNPDDGLPCRKRATEIDHIEPHRGRWEYFIGLENFSNLQGLCHSCHSRKTALEENFGNREVDNEENHGLA
jgi:5-methylcytosine-specific restriction enzyme A